MADYLPFGAGSPAEQAEVGPSFFDRLVAGIINGTVSIPKRVMDATAATAPGLRREDFTDIPATPAPFGFSRPEEHPGSEMRGAALEAALLPMGGTTFSAPAGAFGAGPVARRGALPMDDASRMARAAEQGFEGPWYHGGLRMDRFTESGKINPKRATSGPMPYFTDNPEMASSYAMGKKPDTSLVDNGRVSEYFTVDPKELGWKGARTPVEVERSWHFLPPEVKADILNKAPRVGHSNIDAGEGALMLHPEGVNATGAGADHWNFIMQREAKGNPLAALRHLWHDSGSLIDDPGQLSEIFRLAGYPHAISEARAPWTEARGVFPARIQMKNPLDTTDAATLRDKVLPALEEAFKGDRSRKAQYGVDMWDKNHRYTPREWVAQAKDDLAKGENSYVWTSIPDKVTEQLRRLGYDGILDTGGKGGGMGHTVAIPFGAHQVRSQFAKFDPKNLGKSDLLGALTMGAPVGLLASMASREDGT